MELLSEKEERVLACLAILSSGGPVRASTIAKRISDERWNARYYLQKLVDKNFARRIGKMYAANLSKYVVYLLRVYGKMSFRGIVQKTIELSRAEMKSEHIKCFEEKLESTLNKLLSRGDVTIEASRVYSPLTVSHAITKVLESLDTKWHITTSEGMTMIEIDCPNKFFIYAYEGLMISDIDYILEVDENKLLQKNTYQEETERHNVALRRILYILSTMLNEKIGLLNIATCIQNPKRKILVIIRGDDLTQINQEAINYANRKINDLLRVIERIHEENLKAPYLKWSTIIMHNRYALENALKRILEILKHIKQAPNIKVISTTNIDTIRGEIKAIVKTWCIE